MVLEVDQLVAAYLEAGLVEPVGFDANGKQMYRGVFFGTREEAEARAPPLIRRAITTVKVHCPPALYQHGVGRSPRRPGGRYSGPRLGP